MDRQTCSWHLGRLRVHSSVYLHAKTSQPVLAALNECWRCVLLELEVSWGNAPESSASLVGTWGGGLLGNDLLRVRANEAVRISYDFL